MRKLVLILTLLSSPAYAGEDQECRQALVHLARTVQEAHENLHEQIMQLHEVQSEALDDQERFLKKMLQLEARIRQLEGRR